MPYGNRDNENTFGKEREAYTAIYRAKLANASFRTARPGPFGFRGKIILARRACGIFPESLAFPEAFAVKPL